MNGRLYSIVWLDIVLVNSSGRGWASFVVTGSFIHIYRLPGFHLRNGVQHQHLDSEFGIAALEMWNLDFF